MNTKIPTQTIIIFLSLNNNISLVRMGFLCCTDERVHEPGSEWRIMHIEHGKKKKTKYVKKATMIARPWDFDVVFWQGSSNFQLKLFYSARKVHDQLIL